VSDSTTEPVIIQCTECQAKFDVSGLEPGSAVKCGSCKAILEVPDFAEVVRPSGTVKAKRPAQSEGAVPGAAKKANTLRRERQVIDDRRNRTTRRIPIGEPAPKGGGGPPLPLIAGVAILAIGAIVGLIVLGRSTPTPMRTVEVESHVGSPSKSAESVDEFGRRYAAAGDDDDKLLALAEWAGQNALMEQKAKVLDRILARDPDHAGARVARGEVKHGDRWIPKGELDRIVAESRSRLGPVQDAMGLALLERTTARFQVVMQRSDTADEEAEKATLDGLVERIEKYFKAWYERNKDDLPSYSDGKFSDTNPGTLPRLTLAFFAEPDKYAELCAKHCPKAAKEGGFYDKASKVCWFNYALMAQHPPFYDSFLFNAFTADYDKDTYRTENDYIVWKKGIDSFEYLGEDVNVTISEHYLISIQNGELNAPIMAKKFRDHLEALYAHFQEFYGEIFERRSAMPPMPIYIFEKRENYVRYGQKQNNDMLRFAGGHFDSSKNIMMTFFPDGKDVNASKDPIVVILHEATHALMQYLSGDRQKKPEDLFWLQEGIAEFCAGFKAVSGGKIELGHLNSMRWQKIRSRYVFDASGTKGQIFPLKDLLAYSQAHWFRAVTSPDSPEKFNQMQLIYEQGWALFHFLHHYDNGKYRAKLRKFVVLSMTTGSTPKELAEAFGEIDIATMEREMKEHVKAFG